MQASFFPTIIRAVFGLFPWLAVFFLALLSALAFGLRGILVVLFPILLVTGLIIYFVSRISEHDTKPSLVERLAFYFVEQGRDGMVTEVHVLCGYFSVSPAEMTAALTTVHQLALAPFYWDMQTGRVVIPRVSGAPAHCPQCACDIPDDPAHGKCSNCRTLYVLPTHKKPYYYI
jgi:hypothetical protein